MIYLDHAAATPLLPQALAAMSPYFAENFFNPSSPYLPAKQVREDYNAAKATIARAIGAKATDLIITAGATESINLAFTAVSPGPTPGPTSEPAPGPASGPASKSTPKPSPEYNNNLEPPRPKVLVLATEHDAVLSCAAAHPHALIKVDHSGLIDLTDFKSKLTGTIELVSISLANNELGTIQPIAEISALIRAERQRRLSAGNPTPLFFHSDASQALNLLDVNVARLGVDMLTLNSAKVYGPKGVGALYAGHDVPLRSVVKGGGQERGLRSGTENVPGVIGFAAALSHAKEHLAGNRRKFAELSRLLRQELEKSTPAPVFLGHPKHQLANFVPVCYPGIDAERLIYKLETAGVLVATGAACAASKGQKSHVLAAIGLSDEAIAGSLRLSLGTLNDADNIKAAANLISNAVSAEAKRIGLSA